MLQKTKGFVGYINASRCNLILLMMKLKTK